MIFLSKFPVGSSAKITVQGFSRILAIANLCCSRHLIDILFYLNNFCLIEHSLERLPLTISGKSAIESIY